MTLGGHGVLAYTPLGETAAREQAAALQAARGRGGVEVFEQAMRAQTLERLRLESELRRAIDDGSISLSYQPIVLAEDQQVVALEALPAGTSFAATSG